MNLKEIKEMILLMKENNLTELELEREGLKIRLTRANAKAASDAPGVIIERLAPPMQQQTVIQQPATAPIAQSDPNLLEIKSPMVGTFYRAPSPEASPFVEVGSEVEIGQVVCIVEAMKLMNEIKSEVKGVVKEILIENADPVEFGQIMFKVEKR